MVVEIFQVVGEKLYLQKLVTSFIIIPRVTFKMIIELTKYTTNIKARFLLWNPIFQEKFHWINVFHMQYLFKDLKIVCLIPLKNCLSGTIIDFFQIFLHSFQKN